MEQGLFKSDFLSFATRMCKWLSQKYFAAMKSNENLFILIKQEPNLSEQSAHIVHEQLGRVCVNSHWIFLESRVGSKLCAKYCKQDSKPGSYSKEPNVKGQATRTNQNSNKGLAQIIRFANWVADPHKLCIIFHKACPGNELRPSIFNRVYAPVIGNNSSHGDFDFSS